MKLYHHPLSSYCQKTLMAFLEKGVSYESVLVEMGTEEGRAEYRKFYPLGKVPLLILEDDWMIPESSIIIEYLDTHFDSGTRLIPGDKDEARQVRFKDRMLDLYLNESISGLLFQSWKPKAERDQSLIEKSEYRARVMYDYLEKSLDKNPWVAGQGLTIADCAAAPPLFYAQQVYPYSDYPNIQSYYGRLQERESWQKVMAEAQPHLERLPAAHA